MTDTTAKPAGLDSPFVKTLIGVWRAEDAYGVWEKFPDSKVLKDFIVTKEQRREIPIIGDPDPDVMNRVEKFYIAVGLDIERVTGRMASPMMKMSHEGFGRVILTVGRLVVISKSLRDIHRFGFESFEKLAEAGEKLVDEACKWIDAYPNVVDV
ncbi:putative nitrogen fixation protein [Roseiarcus fermentans]|uniref:Putative nitrogen fixation protein n=1 Tax=Roseiarcus fermentans TaxID=1473586 RepID=A0A366EP73_9HYPH|nr:NifX-associated nitrogen fixation protein [Roseiarcus fermentans]RBP03480.1 putative nitrogen fixation protein [Roseiarcus fermentans]